MEVETWPPLVDGNLGLLGRESSPELNLALSAEDIPSDEERELLQSPITDENQTTCVKNALVNGGEYESEEEKLLHEASAISNCNGHRAGETVSDTASVFRTEKYCEVLRLTEFSDLISKSHHDKEEDISNGAICAATIDGENDHGEESIIRENDVNKKSSLCDPSEGVSGTDVIVENPCSLDVSDEQKLVKGSTEVLVESIAENKVSSVCREEDEDHLLESGLSPKSLKDFGDDLDDMEIPQVIDISSTCVDKETEDTPTAVEVCALDESAIAGEVEGNKVTGDKAEMATTSKDRETVEPNEDEKSITEHVDDLSIVSPKDISPSLAEDNEISASFGGEETENTVSAVAVDTPASGEDAVKLAKEDDDKLVTDSVEEVSVAGEDSTTDYGVEAMTVSGAEEVTVAGEDCTTDCGVEDSGGMAMLCAEDSNEAVSPVEEETMVDDSMDFDQEDGSADYQGMPDDILPIIESELDDMPVGEGNIFDTEVECGDGDTSMQEEAGDTNQETSSNSLTEIENDAASPQPARDQEECSSDSLFSLSPRVKLKRRGSADNVESPPTKVLKRQSSLNELTECAERSGTLSFDEFKKLSTKKLAGTQENIASEPLDIPIDIEMNQTERSPAKRRRMVDDEPKVGSSSSGAESVDQPVEKNVGTQDESLLVIDLDEDDDKTVTVEHPSQSQSPTKEQAGPGDNGPKSALDVLFNGKKEITLNRKMFTRVIKAHISQYLLTFSELGKATNLSLKANDVLNRIQSGISNYEKQKEDFKSIMTKLLEDRQAQKTWDETLVPPRATRSVGLQVCSVGSMYVKNGLDLDDASTSNKLTTSSSRNAVKSYSANSQSEALAQQKQAYAQQQMAMAQSRIKQAERQLNNIRPIAKKSVTPTNRPIAMKTVPVSKPVTPIIPKPQFPITAPKLNGLKAVTVTRNPEPSASPNSSPLTVTTVSPNSRTFTLSNKGTFALKSPLKPATPLTPQFKQTGSSMLSKALSTSPKTTVVTQKSQNSSRAVPIAVSHTPGTVQISKNLASGPGRPGKSPAPPVKKPSSAVSEDATIDLTEDDAPPPSKPSKDSSTARKSTAPSRVGVQAKVPMSNKQLRHPALPPNPHSFDVATAPPRPYLGICDTQTVTQGIMLTWHFNNVIPLRKISKFQVFAYQESKGDGEDAWKKVGDVDALPLPMACTLTQFREGYTYHFIVRALDEAGNVGLFSAPNTITLMKKTV